MSLLERTGTEKNQVMIAALIYTNTCFTFQYLMCGRETGRDYEELMKSLSTACLQCELPCRQPLKLDVIKN